MAKVCVNCHTRTDGGELSCKKCRTSAFLWAPELDVTEPEEIEPSKKISPSMTIGLVAGAVAVVVGLSLLIQVSPGPRQQESTRMAPQDSIQERADAEEFLSGRTNEPPDIGDKIPIGRLSVGDCIAQDDVDLRMSPIENADLSVTLVDCGAINAAEIYEMTTYDKGTSFRGSGWMGDYLRRTCPWAFEETYGYPENVFLEIEWGFQFDTSETIWRGSQPSINGWRDYSDNSIYCIAFKDNFGLIQTPNPSTIEGILYQQKLDEQQ